MPEMEEPLESRALQLSRCIEESRRAYSALLEIEREQRQLIDQQELLKTAEKIDEKRSLLEEIEIRGKELQAQHEAWQAVRHKAPESLRQHLQEQVQQLQSVISELLNLQKENEEKLNQHGEEIHRKLVEIQKKKSVNFEYQRRRAGDAYGKSGFYDKKT